MILIVGLGNPGANYEKTYHNIGFLCVDRLAQKLDAKFTKKTCDALVCETNFNGKKVVLAKPQTYMNLSGESVNKLINKFKITPEHVLVILDDIDLEKGTYRYRKSGSAGTHNGLRNIVSVLKTQQFERIRIGIGNNKLMDLADYVLSKIDEQSFEILNNTIEQVCDFIIQNILVSA